MRGSVQNAAHRLHGFPAGSLPEGIIRLALSAARSPTSVSKRPWRCNITTNHEKKEDSP